MKGIIAEVKAISMLAGPVVIAQFAQTANGVVDTMMAGRYSAVDLAGVALGTSFWIPLYLFLAGVTQALLPLVAQYRGADQTLRIGPLMQQGLWLSLVLGVISGLLLSSSSKILFYMNIEAELFPIVEGYLDAMAWGMPAATLFLCFRNLAEGMLLPRPVMIFSILGLLLNIPLNYCLINGYGPFPAMGGVGCGWATTAVMWAMAIGLVLYCVIKPIYRETKWFQHWQSFDWLTQRQLLAIGLPIGTALFVEVSIFSVIALLIAPLGTEVVAGHQIALSVSSMAFMVPLSMSLVLTARVGHHLGRRNLPDIKLTIKVGLLLILGLSLLNSLIMTLFKTPISGLYTQEHSVIQLASYLLMFAAAFQLSDGLQVSANGILRGMKDTKIPMIFTLIAYWLIGLPCGIVLATHGFNGEPLNAAGYWVGLLIGLTFAAFLLLFRVRSQLAKLSFS